MNMGFDARLYIDSIPSAAVGEYHLAGHTIKELPEGNIYIDTHDALVSKPVWDLYEYAIHTIGERSTLIEWDNNLPTLDTLMAEAARANQICEAAHANVA